MTEKKQGYHHGNLRRALLDAALELVKEKGASEVTLREAARRAGVGPSAPYRHFENKQALMLALVEEGVERLVTLTQERMMESGADAGERFQAMGIAYVEFAVRNPAHFRVMDLPEYNDPEKSPMLKELAEQSEQSIRALLLEGQSSGSLAAFDPEMMFLAAQALTYGLARMLVEGFPGLPLMQPDHLQAAELARTITDIFGRGLRRRDEETHESPV